MVGSRSVTGVVLDLDGTVYRLRYDVSALRAQWSERTGVATGTVPKMLDAMTPEARAVALGELSAAEFAGVANGAPVSGAADAIARLRGLVAVAVVSRNDRRAVVAALAELGHADVPVVARGEASAEKPDGAPVLRACELIDSPPRTTVVIGDTSHDVDAATAAGVRSVVVRNPERSWEPDGADRYVDDLAGAVAVIEEWLT
jgi:phosphoglycolate phosphatase